MINRGNTLFLLLAMLAVGQIVSLGVDGTINLPLLLVVLIALVITSDEQESRLR